MRTVGGGRGKQTIAEKRSRSKGSSDSTSGEDELFSSSLCPSPLTIARPSSSESGQSTPSKFQTQWMQWLPPLFASCPDPANAGQVLQLSARLTTNGIGLQLACVDHAAQAYSCVISNTQLESIKPFGMTFQDLGKHMEEQFVKGLLKVYRSEGQVMLIVREDICFELPQTDEGATRPSTSGNSGPRSATGASPRTQASATSREGEGMAIVQEMITHALQSVLLRKMGSPDAQLRPLKLKVEKLKTQIQNLEHLKQELMLHIQRNEEEERQHMETYNRLQTTLHTVKQEYQRLCNNTDHDPFDIIDPPDGVTEGPTGRAPLEVDCRRYDQQILTLLKGRFCPATDVPNEAFQDEGNKWMKVIRPVTSKEYKSQMENLPRCKQRIVLECMDRVDEWDFDVWTIQDMTDHGAMFYTAYALFLKWDLLRRLNIDEQVAINFFSQVEAGYHPNPYHNALHAADVLHIMHFIVGKGNAADQLQLPEHTILACLLAGMIHDYDHPGLNNNFHIKIQSYLATLYNDRSILENHHLAEVFDLMKDPRFNILQSLDNAQYTSVRETMIEIVLATDMGLHSKVFGNWKRRVVQNKNLGRKAEDQRLALSMCIKMADISNCSRPLPMYLKWSTKLVEEFFLQGDNEKERGDLVSPFMDRTQLDMRKSQVAFMTYVIIPMFESIATVLPNLAFTVDIAFSNKEYWKLQDEAANKGN
mmetsp:Transcript_31270/g.56157  ORF Transcript_31270/g.56157 Transcript_31270/m.56157 type:complete len:704 (-) Transcript_31270:435-2546(-)